MGVDGRCVSERCDDVLWTSDEFVIYVTLADGDERHLAR